jgi:integrase
MDVGATQMNKRPVENGGANGVPISSGTRTRTHVQKSGDERRVPLRGDALDALREEPERRDPDPSDYVIVDSDGDRINPDRVSKRFKFYVRKAGLSDREELSFHSCRHTTGSWLSMHGVPLRVISEILGHSSTQVTEMYSHLSPDVMDRAMEETFGSA